MLHGCQISSSREKYSFLLKPTKPSSMFTKNSPWPMEFYQKRSNSWYNKRNDKRSWYSVQPKLQYELWTKHILNISNETIIWQRKGRNWISFEMFVVTLNPNGKKTLSKGLFDVLSYFRFWKIFFIFIYCLPKIIRIHLKSKRKKN